LLAVLPGTGGLTRITDKRKVRRDRADSFCTTEEGIKGKRAAEWRLVDEIAPQSQLETVVATRAREFVGNAEQPPPYPPPPAGEGREGIALTPLERNLAADRRDYKYVSVAFDRAARVATITLRGPDSPPPPSAEAMVRHGAAFWPLQVARELDDAILDIRLNELDVAAIVFKSEGDPRTVLDYDLFLDRQASHWLAREIRLKWKRVLKRIDLTSRSLVALIEPGSCFAGTFAEIVFAADRSYMLIGSRDGDNRPPARIILGGVNLSGMLAMSNGLDRLRTRFLGEPEAHDNARQAIGQALDARAAAALGLITFALDDIDWDDEIRLFLEERASFSPDSLTGLESNLRFAGPETMETKIFARLTAWQNWIFQRSNATGETGALSRYGTGRKPEFDTRRT
jgi:benzoyl-CoA-dihydrodiol lyase